MAKETDGVDPGDDDASTQSSGPETGWTRLSKTFLNPPKAKARTGAAKDNTPVDMSTLSDAERRMLINQIDPLERKIGLTAAALAAVLTVVGTVPYMISKTVVATSSKPLGKSCPIGDVYTRNAGKAASCDTVYSVTHYAFLLVVLLVFSLAILVTVRIGRRAPVAFSITLTGLALGSLVAQTIIVLPFLAAGGWLLLRAWRSQRYGSPSAKTAIPGFVPPARGAAARANAKNGTSGTASRSSSSTTNASRRSRKGQPVPSPTGRQPATPNKRYTPKAPPKKKPPSPTD